MRSITVISILLFMILVVSLALVNLEPVEIHYYDLHLNLQTIHSSIIIAILGAFASGFLVAWLFGKYEKVKLKAISMKQSCTIHSLEKEVAKLKTTPTLPQIPVQTGDAQKTETVSSHSGQ